MNDESYVQRAEREFKDAKKLWKRGGWTLFILLVAAIGYGSYVMFWGIPALEKKNTDLEAEKKELRDDNQRLHNKAAEADAKIADLKQDLLPFKIYSLEKYGGKEREALAKLAKELDRIESQIRTFTAQMTLMVSGQWLREQPRPMTIMDAVGHPYLTVLSTNKDATNQIAFRATRVQTRRVDQDRVEIECLLGVDDGKFPLGADTQALRDYGNFKLAVPAVSGEQTTNGVALLQKIEIVLSVNGASRYRVQKTNNLEFKIPPQGSYSLFTFAEAGLFADESIKVGP
jgi:hypothetical protein